jgi:hypothetical protein
MKKFVLLLMVICAVTVMASSASASVVGGDSVFSVGVMRP